MRIVFLGTPQFGCDILKAILDSRHEILAVVAQPDRANARGKKIVFSPVKSLAIDNNLPLYQFEKISKDGVDTLKSLNADIFITAAYGQILSGEVLNIPKFGVINVHGSILPRYRGASPIQCAIMNGDDEIGVTIMKTALSVDSGDILLIKKVKITDNQTAGECFSILGRLGGEAILEGLELIENGKANYTAQDEKNATYCKKLSKEDLVIDFSKSVLEVVNLIRALSPSPSAYTNTPHGRLKILKAEVGDDIDFGIPGEVVRVDKHGILIKCEAGSVKPLVVMGEGGKAMLAADYFRGKRVECGTVFK